MGNPRPVFWAQGLQVLGTPKVVGEGHLKLRLGADGSELDAIGFRMAQRVPSASLGNQPVDILFHLQENEYRGTRTLQARLLDLRPSGTVSAA
jgi:single-stranded-DNA-specific exonuclease